MLKQFNLVWQNISPKLFEYYLYLCLAWVFFALGFDIYMIIKHFDEL